MASFGYGVGDILALTKLAWDVVQNSKKACGEYDELTQELTSFHTVLKRVEDEAKNPDCPFLTQPDQKLELQSILLPCHTVLHTLNQIIQQYNALPPSKRKEGSLASFWQSVCFGNTKMQDLGVLRDKMTARMMAISVFLNTLAMGSLGRIEQKMNGDLKFIKLAVNEEIARLLAAPSNGREGSILTCYGDDDKAVWKEFRRSLVKQGFNSKLLERKKEIILGYITELGNSDVLDDKRFGASGTISNSEIQSTEKVVGNGMGSFGKAKLGVRKRRGDGYKQCGAEVMGLWAKGTHRFFRPSQLHFEVVFETPFFFVSHPRSEKGPILKQPIYFLNGSPSSYEETWTEPSRTMRQLPFGTGQARTATWLSLLSNLQFMELESRDWEEGGLRKYLQSKEVEKPRYTLAVGLQKSKNAWDMMPLAFHTPVATTTITHLIEIVAMLGMHWKAFDQKTWQIRAEGNGLGLKSRFADGAEVILSFSRTGISYFDGNRIIPSHKMKPFCFGSIFSIFPRQLKSLAFGNESDVIETLELLGCTKETIAKYAQKHQHKFSIAFEIIGMLSESVRIRGSLFKRLPNPTTDHFSHNVNFFSLICHFRSQLFGHLSKATWIDEVLFNNPDSKYIPDESEIESGNSEITRTQYTAGTTSVVEPKKRWPEYLLLPLWPNDESAEIDPNSSIRFKETVHNMLDYCTTYLRNSALETVLSVISSHITAVLEKLNSPASFFETGFGRRIGNEDQFISIYFREILPIVISEGPLAMKMEAANKSQNEISRSDKEQAAESPVLEEMEVEVAMEGVEREAIWCVLVCRMLCWLLLHDFHEEDVNILPSGLKGSRMQVYIE